MKSFWTKIMKRTIICTIQVVFCLIIIFLLKYIIVNHYKKVDHHSSNIKENIVDIVSHKDNIKINNSYDHYFLDSQEGIRKFYVWGKDYLKYLGYWNFRNFTSEEVDRLSTMGRRLFLHENVGTVKNTQFLIYVYKFGPRLQLRLINHYNKKKISNPFENCSVNNCKISYNLFDFHSADAVFFHLHLLPAPPTDLRRINFNQRWVWLSDESVFNTFYAAKDKNLSHYNDFFNWSMTYRPESDVPVPYGRVVPLLEELKNLDLDVFSKKNKTVAIMGSNCSGGNDRWKYVKALKNHLEIDVYGRCGNLNCPGHFKIDCKVLSSYKFYLAFENSNCKDYITEKTWWNAFEKKSIPIVMGATNSNYKKLLPPNSFIHVDDFDSPQQLAQYIKYLSRNRVAYNRYHLWRSKYKVVNEHGYFQSSIFHYCRLCEALNYNSIEKKTYHSMKDFWNASRDCNNIKYPKKFL